MPKPTEGNIIPISIEKEMRVAYVDYSMSVITSRALPSAYDGLKPVQRRIIYSCQEMGMFYDKPFRKAATIVGDVMGKYHPHGDAPIYEALIRMAQLWSLRYPLIQGQGNLGSNDGDPPAQMRYVEAKLGAIANTMVRDVEKKTVDFRPNFDDSLREPTVLPALLPNLLLNGTSGIAVGMASNMAPHNLTEVTQAIIAYIDDPDISIEGLMKHLKAPDFPTGGIIYGYEGVKEAYHTGRGGIVVRGEATIEPLSNERQQIIVTSLPYQVNKSAMVEKTAMLINQKKLLGIADLRDESDKDGMRIVYELKKDAIPSVVLNNLYKRTALQTTFHINNVALVDGKPKTLNIKALIQCYAKHRHEVVTRRTQYEHAQATRKQHLLTGYLIALDNLDAIISTIKASNDATIAKATLMQAYQLSEAQAKAILEMRLQRLTGLERAKVTKEHAQTAAQIAKLETILASKDLRMNIIKEELQELEARYRDPRRTMIEYHAETFVPEDMIPNDPMAITLSQQGYIKRTPLIDYRTQQRGGIGSRGVITKKEDFSADLFIAHNHDYLLLFTRLGKIFWQKVYTLPEGNKATQGRAIQNLIPLAPDDRVRTILCVPKLSDPNPTEARYIIFATQRGIVKKTPLTAYARPLASGIRALNIQEGDQLLDAKLTSDQDHIILASSAGKAIRFPATEVRAMGRVATGVRGMYLDQGEKVVGMVSTSAQTPITLLVLSEKGYGKRSQLEDYRTTRRGGKGIKTMQTTEKTGSLIAIKAVQDADQLMIINTSGITLRLDIAPLPTIKRATQGVRVLRLKGADSIAAVTTIQDPPDSTQAPTDSQ